MTLGINDLVEPVIDGLLEAMREITFGSGDIGKVCGRQSLLDIEGLELFLGQLIEDRALELLLRIYTVRGASFGPRFNRFPILRHVASFLTSYDLSTDCL